MHNGVRYLGHLLLWVVVLMSGSFALFRELYGMYSGVVPARSLFWSCTVIAFIVGSAILWTIEHREKLAISTELANERLIPAELDLEIQEIYRIPVDHGRDRDPATGKMSYHIFVQSRVKLKKPRELSVLKYSLRLSAYGLSYAPACQSDVDKWQLDIWNPKNVLNRYPLSPLSTQLRSGEPFEGWLHFITEKCPLKLFDECTVALIADTERGAGHKEYPAATLFWNPKQEVSFLPKKIS
jgi:hypothetical protein